MGEAGGSLYPFNFLATDYENYAVSYFCMPVVGKKMKLEWFSILSRSTTLDDALLQEAEGKIAAVLPEFTLNDRTTVKTKQGGDC